MQIATIKTIIQNHAVTIGMVLASICVSVQTYRSRFAFFYSDDFETIAVHGGSFVDVFSPVNGHFVPVPTIILNGLISLFGVTSYTPFLITAAVLNWTLSLSVAIYCKRNKLYTGYILMLPSLILIIPNSAHTIFWTGAALNLLPLALLIYFTTVSSIHLRVTQTIIFTLIGIGFGGYGLILVAGIVFSNFLRRERISSFISLFFVIPLSVYYALDSSKNSQIEFDSYVSWFFQSCKLVLDLLIPGLLPVSWTGPAVIAIAVFGTALILVDSINIFRGKAATRISLDFTLIASLFIFSLLVWIARGGVEPLIASRYVVIFSTLLLINTIRGLQTLEYRFNLKGLKAPVQKYFLWVLLGTSILRAPLWLQAPLDINYQSGINRSIVLKYLCAPENEFDWNAVSQIDGLSQFELSRKSPLWVPFQEERC